MFIIHENFIKLSGVTFQVNNYESDSARKQNVGYCCADSAGEQERGQRRGVEKPGGLFNTCCLTGWGGMLNYPGVFSTDIKVECSLGSA